MVLDEDRSAFSSTTRHVGLERNRDTGVTCQIRTGLRAGVWNRRRRDRSSNLPVFEP